MLSRLTAAGTHVKRFSGAATAGGISRSVSIHVLAIPSLGYTRGTDQLVGVRWQSILHGSPQAKEEGLVEVQQHSKLVARGKYVHAFEGAQRTSTGSSPLWLRRTVSS